MASYGMGPAEAFSLKLDDIDWVGGSLRIVRPKSNVDIHLPLMAPVARAIVAYLRRGRPRGIAAREVFVRVRAPYRRIGDPPSAVFWMLEKYSAVAGIARSGLTGNSLRRTFVSRPVDAGVPPKVVSEIVGHTQSTSISPYLRIAIERLRSASLPIPRP